MTTWIWAAMLLGGSLLGLLRGQPEAVSNAILDPQDQINTSEQLQLMPHRAEGSPS